MLENDDDFLGSEDEIQEAAGDELDLAETVSRLNPIADQLQHFANMRSVKHAMLDKQAPFARVNPPSVLKGSLGNQASVSWVLNANGDPVGEQKQVAAWVGDDAETLPVSICFGRLNDPIITRTALTINPYGVGIIQFGTKASLLTAEVDIGMGCQLTLPASMVTLQVKCEPRVIAGTVLDTEPLLLSGMISFHPVVRTASLTRTILVDDITVLTNYRIPLFAKSVRIVKRNQTEYAKLGTLILFDDDAGPCGYFEIPASTQQATSILIPPAATSFSIYDDATLLNLGCAAVFELAL